jgi:hypothetical protein
MTKDADDSKLRDAPAPDSPVEMIAAFLTLGYGLPEGYYVSRVVRHGGRSGTGISVFIMPPGEGAELGIHYERESDCMNPTKLRAQAAADTRGLTRAWRINSQMAAGAMYEALCSMADNFTAADLRGQTWEWVQQLRRVAAVTVGGHDSYWALRRLQDHRYSRSLVQDPPRNSEGKPVRPIPMLLHDLTTDYYYVTARHMAVFLRYDLGVENAGDDDRIITRLCEIGGERVPADAWDSTTRERAHRIRLVLYRLPDEASE